MKTSLRTVMVLFFSVLSISTSLASDLDSYYLAAYGKHQHGHAINLEVPQRASPNQWCRTPLTHSLRRDWDKLAAETRRVLAEQLAVPVLSGSPATFSLPDGHFTIHYTTSGIDLPHPTDDSGNNLPLEKWVETVAQVFEEVYAFEVGSMGYRPAPTGSSARYDIYLKNLAATGAPSIFGESVSQLPVKQGSTSFTSFITIDSDFSRMKFGNQFSGYTPLKALQITASHEYFHAIQFGCNFFFDIWYAEASATWVEEELYDDVNQLYAYLPAYFQATTLGLEIPASVATGGGYGRWIFNRYLAENHQGKDVVREFWDRMATTAPTPGMGDIRAVPILNELCGKEGIGQMFLGFAKRAYTRNWTTHVEDVNLIYHVVPVATYTSLPVGNEPMPVPDTALQPLSFAFYKFSPSAQSPRQLIIKADSLKDGFVAVAFRKDAFSGVTEYAADASGMITVPFFNDPSTKEVFLLVCNTNTAQPEVQDKTERTETSSISGGGGGCFIATAAYGSSLHPKVQILRDFRDKWLVTNLPGRIFVSCYYAISPPIAGLIEKNRMLQVMSQWLLAPVFWAIEYHRVMMMLIAAGLFAGACRLMKVSATWKRG